MLSMATSTLILTAEIIEASEPGLRTATIHGNALDEMSGMTNANAAGQVLGA